MTDQDRESGAQGEGAGPRLGDLPGKQAGRKGKVGGFLDLIPVVGRPLKYLYENYGIGAIVFVVIGFGLGWAQVKWGQAPDFIAGRYKGMTATVSSGPRPTQVLIERVDVPRDIQPYFDTLEDEGVRAKGGNPASDFLIGSFEGRDPAPQTGEGMSDFGWRLRAGQGFEITGYAFRLSELDAETTFQRLKAVQEDARSVRFTVPVHKRDDRLVVILKVTWNQGPRPASMESVMTSGPA